MHRIVMTSCVCALLAVGCAPADVAGNYMAATTSEENECSFSWWTEGDMSAGIPVVVTQDGGEFTADVQGLGGGALALITGHGSTFVGEVGGSHLHGRIVGTTNATSGGCSYTITVDLDADLSGDTLTGTLTYRPVTNHAAECGALETCSNVQRFNATRPPT